MLYEPKFNSGINFDSFVKDSVKIENSFKGICHQNEKTDFVGDLGMYSNYIFLIGPEGDFTDDEIQLAIENDFNEIHLGNNRLRTETAGLFSIISVRSRFK
jgi:16S rRNA (uracil1498-N3)-methyltransferase